MIDQETPVTAPSAPAEKPPRRWWLILTVAASVAVIVVTATVHLLGPHGALIAGAIAAGVVVLAAVIWRLPHLRRHFAGLRGRSRSRSFSGGRKLFGSGKARGGAGRGLLPKLGRGRSGGPLGGKRAAGTGRRGLGAMLGRKRAGSGIGGGKSGRPRGGPLGKLPGRSGSGRKLLGGALLGRGRSRSAAGAARPKAGPLRRAGRALVSPFRRPAGSRAKSSGKTGTPAGRAFRGMGRGLRGTWRGTGGKLFPGRKAGTPGGTKTGAKSRSRRSPAAAARTAGRAVKSGWKRARKVTGGKTGGSGKARPPWQRIAGGAGALALLPLIGVVAGVKRFARWRRKRASPDTPEPAPGPEKTAAGPEDAAPAPDAQPGPALNPKQAVTFTGTTGMRGAPMTHVEAAAEAVREHIGGFPRTEPTGVELDRFLHDLPQLYQALSEGLSACADGLGDMAVHPSVHQHLQEMAAAAGGQAEYADEAWSLHRTAHERELERIENPRPREDMWDVGNQ